MTRPQLVHPVIGGAVSTSPESAKNLPLTREDILEFRSLIAKETGVDISAQEAWNRAIELVDLFRMLIGRIPEDGED